MAMSPPGDHPAGKANPEQRPQEAKKQAKGTEAMSVPAAGTTVDEATREAFTALALGQASALEQATHLREQFRQTSGLDPRSFALVKIAALVAQDAPPASYLWQVAEALDAGVTPKEILGVLVAVAPQVGVPRVIAAAPEIMVALDIELPADRDM
jgi:alkylhydroperoxidase/carboxymuconolactone decarboxylase family protein YurZ